MTLTNAVRSTVEATLGRPVAASRWLSAGHNAALIRVDLADGRRLVVKQGRDGAKLDLEGFMLRYLAQHSSLPVPAVHVSEDDLLVMDLVEAGGGIGQAAQCHAAELIADLHGVTAPLYGFERDTLIGPLDQPNPQGKDWVAFFRDSRLLFMARRALEERQIDVGLMTAIERLADRLDRYIDDPAPPTLIHGDLWGGNVLCAGNAIAGFIDPAIYHADPEIELAFSTLFGTFGQAFFKRYAELRPMRDGFFEVRRDLYNLYPLLVHVRLFGGSYVGSVQGIVRRFAG